MRMASNLGAPVIEPPGKQELKASIGDKLSSVGLCNEAVDAYLKAEQPKLAIDCCVMLNEWDYGIKLAEQYKVPQIESLLTKYASHLLNKNKLFIINYNIISKM